MGWRDELRRLGGAASKRQLRAAGASDRALTAAVATGTVLRPRNGRYVLPDIPGSVLTAVRAGARLTCVSAARSYGLWGGMDPRTHLLVPAHAGRSEPPESPHILHWGSVRHPEIWRVSFADTLRAVARCADTETAVAVFDTALSSGRMTLTRLRALFAEEPRRLRDLAARARPGSDSGVESILRQRLQARGHHVEQQLSMPGVGRVDMRIDGTLFVEVDGYRFHADRDAFERDRMRDTGLALAGARWLRVPARHILDTPDAVIATIEAVLETEEFRRRTAG